jgi:hypothetical protein
MRPRLAVLAVVLLAFTPVAWSQDLCALVRDTTHHLDVDASSATYQALGDAYTGGAEERWRGAPGARIYQAMNEEGGPAIVQGEILGRLRALEAGVRASPAFADQRPNGGFLRETLIRELEAVRARVEMLQEDVELEWNAAKEFIDARWDRKQSTRVCGDREFATDTLFFGEGDPKSPVGLRIVPFDDLDPDVENAIYLADPEQAAEFRVVVAEVNSLFLPFRLAALNRTAHRLDEIDEAWENYLTKGYSQYPWEALVNSWRRLNRFSWSSPPTKQFVFLHPEPAMVIDARATEGAALDGSLLLHGLGYIQYFGATRNWFLGASVTGSVTTDEDLGLGVGGTLHFGHSAIQSRVPHVSLSVLFHDTRSGSSGPFIGVSVDLWRLFETAGSEGIYRSALSGR